MRHPSAALLRRPVRRSNSDVALRGDRGLTLIELLIVIVILGILSAIIVFSVEGITNRGEAASCDASAQTVRIAAQAFYAQGQGPDQPPRYPTDLVELQSSDFIDTLPGTVSPDSLSLTFATGASFVYDPATGSVDSTSCDPTVDPDPTAS